MVPDSSDGINHWLRISIQDNSSASFINVFTNSRHKAPNSFFVGIASLKHSRHMESNRNDTRLIRHSNKSIFFPKVSSLKCCLNISAAFMLSAQTALSSHSKIFYKWFWIMLHVRLANLLSTHHSSHFFIGLINQSFFLLSKFLTMVVVQTVFLFHVHITLSQHIRLPSPHLFRIPNQSSLTAF
jgi:hypothetical protein